jgi:hypothetical protein
MRRPWRLAFLVGVVTLMLVSGITPAASGRSNADDLTIGAYLLPQGSGTRTRALNFQIGVEIASSSGVQRQITVRISLPAGLRWGNDGPDPSEGCTVSDPAVCTTTTQPNPVGTLGAGWVWDVVAERTGFYVVPASVESAEPDPNTSNNSIMFRFEVAQASGGGGGSGGGGSSVSASTVKLKPRKAKAGNVVAASVRVAAGSTSVRPTRLSCAGTIGGAKVAGTPRAATGTATCLYRTPKTAKGKTLRGTISFTAGGKRLTRRFAVRLG